MHCLEHPRTTSSGGKQPRWRCHLYEAKVSVAEPLFLHANSTDARGTEFMSCNLLFCTVWHTSEPLRLVENSQAGDTTYTRHRFRWPNPSFYTPIALTHVVLNLCLVNHCLPSPVSPPKVISLLFFAGGGSWTHVVRVVVVDTTHSRLVEVHQASNQTLFLATYPFSSTADINSNTTQHHTIA